MQAIMFARKPGLRSEYALSMGKRARTYHYQHIQENTPLRHSCSNNGPRGEQPQRQRVTSHNQVGDLQGNRQPECPALPRRQPQCTEEGNNPSQEKHPRQKCSRNSDNSPWRRVAMRDVVVSHEASEKSDQAYDDQEETM